MSICISSIASGCHESQAKIYKYKGRKIDDIILLLDDIRIRKKILFKNRFLDKDKDGLDAKFKEVWYVGTYENQVYKIF